MKQSHIVSLLQTGYATVEVSYDFPNGILTDNTLCLPVNVGRFYTFKMLLNMAEAGDLIAVPHDKKGVTIVQVTKVHDTPQIDLDADYDYKWAVCKLDLSAYDKLITVEQKALGQLRIVEADKRRTEVLEGLKNVMGDGLTQLEYDVTKSVVGETK
jgi:hypothetical protein